MSGESDSIIFGSKVPKKQLVECEMASTEMVDVMDGAARQTIKIHEHGFISLIDVMPRVVPKDKTADYAIVQAARVSYGTGTKTKNDDTQLLRYLMRHSHFSPFEMVEFKFHISLPIFVMRQLVRHRTASLNEMSGRYTVLPEKFFVCKEEEVRAQSKSNKQGSEGIVPNHSAAFFIDCQEETDNIFQDYRTIVESGVAKELARTILPLGIYTEIYWKCDLRNIMNFLKLRMDSHAQKEIRDYANAMFNLISPIVPDTMQAFIDYELEAIKLSRDEVKALSNYSIIAAKDLEPTQGSFNKIEQQEWNSKLAILTSGEKTE